LSKIQRAKPTPTENQDPGLVQNLDAASASTTAVDPVVTVTTAIATTMGQSGEDGSTTSLPPVDTSLFEPLVGMPPPHGLTIDDATPPVEITWPTQETQNNKGVDDGTNLDEDAERSLVHPSLIGSPATEHKCHFDL
jgi:hypothetical protein